MISVFCGLKFTTHFVDHACNFTRSQHAITKLKHIMQAKSRKGAVKETRTEVLMFLFILHAELK
jgi:hypothetical protein